MVMDNITSIRMEELARQVLGFMLAPDVVQEDPSVVGFFVSPTREYKLQLNLQWGVPAIEVESMFAKPETLIKGLEKFLASISKRITYGEVVALRDEVAAKQKELDALRQKVSELQRYRDALEIVHGGKLS